jgi:hypothetical protein
LQFSLQAASPETFGYSLVYLWRGVYNVLKKYKLTDKFNSPRNRSNDTVAIVTMRNVNSLYFSNSVPAVNKILAAVNEDFGLTDFKITTMYLYELLKCLN